MPWTSSNLAMASWIGIDRVGLSWTEKHVVTASDPADAMKFVEAVLGQVAKRQTPR
jgi:hypothetical protein